MSTHQRLPTIQAQQLTDAFRQFNELSEHLSASYQALEEQVGKLHRELAEARSQRLKTLEEKEQLAEWLEKILSALPAGVVVLDIKGSIIDFNQKALECLGEPLFGEIWSDVLKRNLTAVTGNPHEYRLPNGRHVSLDHQQLDGQAGQIIVLSDVSEMRSLQETIHQQQQLSAMGEMVASLAHQIRTPLSTAILYISQIDNPNLSADKRRQFSQKILQRLQFLEGQVNDMLLFVKDGRLAMTGFALSALLNHLTEAAKDSIGQADIILEISNRAKAENLRGNEPALRGALMNLIGNAADAIKQSGKPGRIGIAVHQTGSKHIEIKIEDTGNGIDPALSQRIFEPFFTTKPSGTGLGLAIVKQVIEAHGGSVTVKSQLGSGTCFFIALPCIESQALLLPSGFSSKNHLFVEKLNATV